MLQEPSLSTNELSKPPASHCRLMGVLNITPDSFFDGGSYFHFEDALSKGIQLAQDGADIIDIGGASSKPFSTPVAEDEEYRRIIPVIKALSQKVKVPISIDTTNPNIARAALDAGARFINDVEGFKNQHMQALAVEFDTEICVMHMQGSPQTMQVKPYYRQGVLPYLLKWFEKKLEQLVKAGIKKDKICIDPGIGFGKTLEHNLDILQNIEALKTFGVKIVVGLSRKSFMTTITGKPSQHLLPTTLAFNTLLMEKGIDILRVHDVYEHRLVKEVMQSYQARNKASS